MPQSRRWSAFEAATNTIVSFVVAWILYFTLVPWLFGLVINPLESAGMVMVFNAVSLIRQFILRRIFNALEK